MRTPPLAALSIILGLLAALGLSGCGDTATSDYDYQRAAPELPEIVPVKVHPGRFGTVGVYAE